MTTYDDKMIKCDFCDASFPRAHRGIWMWDVSVCVQEAKMGSCRDVDGGRIRQALVDG